MPNGIRDFDIQDFDIRVFGIQDIGIQDIDIRVFGIQDIDIQVFDIRDIDFGFLDVYLFTSGPYGPGPIMVKSRGRPLIIFTFGGGGRENLSFLHVGPAMGSGAQGGTSVKSRPASSLEKPLKFKIFLCFSVPSLIQHFFSFVKSKNRIKKSGKRLKWG